MSNSMYSAAQLAEMCLSSLPTTRQAIDHKAKRENWHSIFIDGVGRGGKTKVYRFEALPTDVQNEINAKQLDEVLANTTPMLLPSLQVDLFPNQGV